MKIVDAVVTLRPIGEHDGPELRRMLATPEIRARWGPVPVGFPFGDDPRATRLGIVAGGRLAGLIQYTEEPEPVFRHAWIDLSSIRLGTGRGSELPP